jgi:Flp pilus assembly pilin Flp
VVDAASTRISNVPGWKTPTVGRKRHKTLSSEDGQDIAEYAVLLVLILILVLGAVRFVGEDANGTFSRVADALQQQVSDGDSD